MSQGKSFFNHGKWQIKLLSEFFMQVTFNILLSDSNSKNNNSQGFKNSWTGYEGMCMSRGKFLKPWQVTDKIIEWIFIQFTFNILQVTLTQKIITCIGFWKFTNGFKGMCMSRGKFLKPWQVTDKIIDVNFYTIHIQLFMSDSNSKNNNM